jgi:gluconolactonase
MMAAGAAAMASPVLGQAPPNMPLQPPTKGPQVAPPEPALKPPYPVVGSIEQLDPSLSQLIDVKSPVEKVLGGFVWIEGPVWVGGKDGYLLCSDVKANKIVKWSSRTGGETWKQPSGYEGPNNEGWAPNLAEPGTNGLIRARGGLVVCDHGNRQVAFVDLKTRAKTSIVSRFEGKRFNSPNDATLHPNGAIYFTDPPFALLNNFRSPDREMDYTGVFRLNPDNSVTLIDKTLSPNGIGLSPKADKLYVTNSTGWVVFDVDRAGNCSNRRTFVDRSVVAGGDGLKIDHLGNMWASSREGVSIFNPEGKRIGIIRCDDRLANCEIGADGYLYITSNIRLVRVKVKVKKIARANA